MKREKQGSLNDNEKASYMARALEKQVSEGRKIDETTALEICIVELVAAVDTTSSVLS